MSGLKVFESSLPEWVIAENEEEAQQIYTAYWQEEDIGLSEDELAEFWEECDLDREFTFYEDIYCREDSDSETKTFREWIAEKGKGYFASSEY